MKMRLLPLAVAAVIAAPVPALALDEAAVMQRLEQLEQQRRADQAEIDALRQKVEQLQSGGGATLSSSEAQQLREEIIKVDKRAASRVGSLRNAVDAERDKLTVNGFMSVYATKATDAAVQLGTGTRGGDWDFRADTVAGVQFTYRLDAKTDAVVQILAEGREDYELDASWAFLRHALTPDTTVRAGRMALPLYLNTETIDVGFTYPWVRPPIEMYAPDVPRYQGVELKHDFRFGDWTTSVQALVGDNDDSGTNASYVAGVAATLSKDAWTFRGSYILIDELENARAPGFIADKFTYSSLAARYDDGAWLAIVEGSYYEADGTMEPLLAARESFYATLGYQFNRLMPYATFAKSYTLDDSSTLLKMEQESFGLGLRYTLTDKIFLKGEATKFRGFNGTAGVEGMTVTDPRNDFVGYLDTLDRLDKDGVTVMSIGFDAVF